MNRNLLAIPDAPYHPLSSLVTIILDNLFSGPEDLVMPISIPLTMFLSFTVGTISVTLTQHYLAHDEWGVSWAKGVAAGVIAGVPFSVTGTAAGALMLGWSGLNHLLPTRQNEPPQLPPPDENRLP
jgi:hypothetical protein